MSTQDWTPAPRPGVIPLHPLDFGTILGRSFTMLRHNPSVLLGFAVTAQFVVGLAMAVLVSLITEAGMSRLSTLDENSDDFEAIMAGTTGLTLVGSLLLSLVSVAVGAAVQGVVAANLRDAVLGERPRLAAVWRRVKPVFWRLLGYALLLGLVVGIVLVGMLLVIIAVGVGIGTALGEALGIGLGVGIGLLVALLLLPLFVWLATKLMLVPSAIVIEQLGIRAALKRSWRLTRGRFWVTFGAVALIGIIMTVAANAMDAAFTLLGMLIVGVLMPTGDPFASDDVLSPTLTLAGLLTFFLPQAVSLVVGAIGSIAQNTAAGIVYLDSRMRTEALDQTLIGYIEHRAVGWSPEQLGDPYAVHAPWAMPAGAARPGAAQATTGGAATRAYAPMQDPAAAPHHPAAQDQTGGADPSQPPHTPPGAA